MMTLIAPPDGYIVLDCPICDGSGIDEPFSYYDHIRDVIVYQTECVGCAGAGTYPVEVIGVEEAS